MRAAIDGPRRPGLGLALLLALPAAVAAQAGAGPAGVEAHPHGSVTTSREPFAPPQIALEAKLLAPAGEASEFDQFGFAVGVLGTTVFVGAPLDDTAGENAGAVYVHTRAAGAWSLADVLLPADANAGQQFGKSLAVDPGTGSLVVGSPADADIAPHRGSAYGMNLANSANPVIARVLMDLGLLNKEFGTLVMTATVVDDLVNWTLFAIVLGQIAAPGGAGAEAAPAATAGSLGGGIALVLLFVAAVLVLGRLLGPPVLHWLRTRVSWPSSFIAALTVAIFVVSMTAEQLGVHAFLGAFLVGASIGGIEKERHEAHDAVAHFALSFFAPIYFVSMGMGTNFVTNFDAVLVTLVLTVGCLSKMGAVLLGARMAGMSAGRETWAIAFALNARGATGIILAGVGRAHGVIDDRLFVAMVVMAVITSLMSGPAIRALLGLDVAAAGATGVSRPIAGREVERDPPAP